MLRNTAHQVPSDLRFDVIGGVVLIDASGELEGAMSERLSDHLEQIRGSDRPVVLDLTRVTAVGDDAVAVLRAAWRSAGDRLRVVAAPGSATDSQRRLPNSSTVTSVRTSKPSTSR